MMRSIFIWLVVIVILVLGIGSAFIFSSRVHRTPVHTATTTESVPVTPVETAPEPLSSRVVLVSPSSGSTVSRTFDISGRAPGAWFFEAQFPVQVRDTEGNVIGRAAAHTDADWMTESVIPFSAHVELNTVYHGEATLVLLKDNPSGLPEHDDAVTIPIVIN